MSAVAGLVALLLAAVIAVELCRLLRNARRAARINRALHELRRPLQAVALALGGEHRDLSSANACLEQARCALGELDGAINGGGRVPGRARVALADVATALEDRWRGAGVQFDPPLTPELVIADPGRLGAALDNLVANALRHGTAPVSVRALSGSGVACFEVRDGGPAEGTPPVGHRRDPRHGHGLRVAASVAASHGGALVPPRPEPAGGTLATLSVPTAMADAAAPPAPRSPGTAGAPAPDGVPVPNGELG